MSTRSHASTAAALLLLIVLPGCYAVDRDPAYDLAQQCVEVRAADDSGSLSAAPDGSYSLVGGQEGVAPDRFYAKPTGLGRFLLYDQGRGFLAIEGSAVRRQTSPSDAAEWAIHEIEVNDPPSASAGAPLYGLTSTARNARLRLSDNEVGLQPRLWEGLDAGSAWQLVPMPIESCTAYPEAALDAVVSPAFHEPRDVDQPVFGWADLHTHVAFPKSMGALAMAGGVVHRFGIEHALSDCTAWHGEDGSRDLLGGQNGSGAHDTTGYPELTEWPTRHSTTHLQAYYRWIERAFLSGLRLIVTDATGNRTLCQALSLFRPFALEGDCSPASTVELQTKYIYEIQDYIDAQEGGPGEGWFRVVQSPAEARAAIASNKLAVVIGVEYGELFDCRDRGATECTPAYVDQELAKIHDLGVRSVFPIHRYDNAFGGTRLGPGDRDAWLNIGNRVTTSGVDHVLDLFAPGEGTEGEFWAAEECAPGINGREAPYDLQAFFVLIADNPLIAIFNAFGVLDKFAPIPTYAEVAGLDHVCNPRSLQPIGEYLVDRLMDLGMIIEIDHLSPNTLFAMLDIIEARDYSGVVSSHGWIENQPAVRDRIFALGGLMSPFNSTPSSIADQIDALATEMSAHPYPIGVGTSTDLQGVTSQASGDSGEVTTYPFDSFDGLVSFTPPSTGTRSFDFDQEGLAHYGLIPEWVDQLRRADEDEPGDVMATFMNSAEAYISMWERAEAGAGAR